MNAAERAAWKAEKMAATLELPPWHRRVAQDAVLDTVLVWERLEQLTKGAGCPYCGSHDLDDPGQTIVCRGCGKEVQ